MKKKFNVDGMSCAACSAGVERVVSRIDGVKKVEVSLVGKSMVCDYNEKKVTDAMIISAVGKAGFTASLPDEKKAAPTVGDGFTPMRTRLIISVVFIVLLMYVSMGHMVGAPLPHFLHGTESALSFAFLQFILTLPVVYVNRKFFFSGFRALVHLVPNMDSLVAVGASAALLYGVYAIFRIGYSLGHADLEAAADFAGNLYFESAAMILTLVTVGKLLEERSKGKTGAALEKLRDLSPQTATVIREGAEVRVPVESIIAGDTVVIRPGESIPVDGTVLTGMSETDESAVTGESMPVAKTVGDKLISATVNLNGSLTMRAEQVGKDTTLSRIIALVTDAGASKAPISRLADRVAGVFVPIVMAVSLLTAAVWMIFDGSAELALSAGISVLVISCPCALGLATPLAITVATGRLAGRGILVKNAASIEMLSKIDTVVFDKTGTLTEGKPEVIGVFAHGVTSEELIILTAALETASEHPLARAILAKAGDGPLPECVGFRAVPGRGVTATVNGEVCCAGNAAYMRELGITVPDDEKIKSALDGGGTPVYVLRGGKYIGAVVAADKIRETSREAVEKLNKMKIKTVMLTGDNERTAAAVAKKLGLSDYIAGVLPDGKDKAIAALQEQGRRVAMVGDGINDSPALARADIGMAIGGGTDIAVESGDVVLLNSDPLSVCRAVAFGRRTLVNIRENLFWAFFYNVLGIPVAAGVLYPAFGIMLSPMIGAACMSLSSLFVTGNALRLYKEKKE